jgi:hypothetical protein
MSYYENLITLIEFQDYLSNKNKKFNQHFKRKKQKENKYFLFDLQNVLVKEFKLLKNCSAFLEIGDVSYYIKFKRVIKGEYYLSKNRFFKIPSDIPVCKYKRKTRRGLIVKPLEAYVIKNLDIEK